MSNLNLEVSQDDLLQLSAMLDGEIDNSSLDVLLARMTNEPALMKAWTRLSQVQAAAHRHAQTGFHLDLSSAIAEKLATCQPELVPTPVVSFRSPHTSFRQQNAQSAPLKPLLPNTSPEVSQAENERKVGDTVDRRVSSVLDSKPYNSVDRRRMEQRATPVQKKVSWFSRKKSLKQQLLAHLAVAASVASVTVWVQNSFIGSADLAKVSPANNIQAEMPIAGAIPAALRNAQSLPMATVGSGAASQGIDTPQARLEPAGGSAAHGLAEDVLQAEAP